MSDNPPPPPPPLENIVLKSAKPVEIDENELDNVKLRTVKEEEKHYVTHLEMIQKMEQDIAKEQQEHFQGYLDQKYQKEYFDEPEELASKAKKLAKMIKKAKHFVCFTGAGISTAAGIPDFRSPDGEWTLAAEGKVRKKKAANFIEAFPTFSHMVLVALHNSGKMKYLISQNCDGIHLKSGIRRERISELHGNVNLEFCEEDNCQKEYYRDWSARRKVYGHDHYTGRHCDCGGRLMESTVDFNQSMPIIPLKRAYENVKKCDLMLVLGSSCQVYPAAGMPKKVAKKKGGKLVIVNIQKTPLYEKATLNIHGKIDDVMKIVRKELKLKLPKWEMIRIVQFEGINKEGRMRLKSLLWNDDKIHWCTMFRKVVIEPEEEEEGNQRLVFEKEPFEFEVEKVPFKVTLYPEKHFHEPLLSFIMKKKLKEGEKSVHEFRFDPFKREWIL